MRGDISSAKASNRHPLDWYCEEQWVTAQLFGHLGFMEERRAGEAIWDPAAGYGSTCALFADRGYPVFMSDVVDNVNWREFDLHIDSGPAKFFPADFLELTEAPAPCSIVCNPPYSYKKGILEAFVRHALRLATRRVCMLTPIKWLASQSRFNLFMADCPPAKVLVLTQRPSMPPGDRIHLMGNRAFRGGTLDYCWIVWNVQEPTLPGETRTIWLPPLGGAVHG